MNKTGQLVTYIVVAVLAFSTAIGFQYWRAKSFAQLTHTSILKAWFIVGK